MKPFKIKQRDTTDCGAACLASIAAFYGLQVPVAQIRQLASTDKKGTNIQGMIEAAGILGFQAKGVKGTSESLTKISTPAIAHVIVNNSLNHYLAIYEITASYIKVMDPAAGKLLQYTHDKFRKIWTGVLILLWPGEKFNKGNKKVSVVARCMNLLFPYRNITLQVLLGACVYTIIGLTTSIYVQKIVDYVIVDGNRNLLNLLSAVMVILLLLATVIGYLKSKFILQTGQQIDERLILGYYQHLLKLPQQFFDNMRFGEILSRINDAVKIRTFVNDLSVSIAVNFFIILFSFVLMFTYYWKLAAVALMIIPIYSFIYFITNNLNKKTERRIMEVSAVLESQFVESLTSMSTIKSFGLEMHAKQKTENKFYSLLQSIYRSGTTNLVSNFSAEFISRLFTIILLWCGTGFVLENVITPGELLSFYSLTGYFIGPAANLIGFNKSIQNAFIAADRLFEIMDLEPETRNNKINLVPELLGDIELKNVCFRYGTRVTVFKSIDLTIPKGKVTALVGESGSGKSTLIHILLNLYPIHSGSVHIGEWNLKYIENNSLRKCLSVVPQKIDLFAGTVIENIAIGDDRPDMQNILSICTSLGMVEFIENLPAGFNTILGENGVNLSGGQRQRVAIARALYRNPEVLILDEATSALDSTAEIYVWNTINLLRAQNKTVILIAHRLSTVYQADKIIALDGGCVAEEGTHHELLLNRKLYYQLWKKQFPMMEERQT